MRSSLTSASRFLWITSLAALPLAACDDGSSTCGPGSAPANGVSASSVDVTLTYGGLEAGLNNDCPDPAAPAGVVSMTIAGTQVDGTGLFTICVPRPDRLGSEELALSIDIPGMVQPGQVAIVDVSGTDVAACTYSFDATRPPTGSATATGLCDNGANPDGFALILDGAISLQRTCGTTVDQIGVTLKGTVAVVGPQD